MKKTLCNKCNTEISNANYKKHHNSCNGKGLYRPLTQCKWCNLIFDADINRANHVRWCDSNPQNKQYREDLSKRSTERNFLITEESRKKNIEGIKKAHAEGKYDHIDRTWWVGRNHSEESKQKQREKALASPHRRLVRSCRDYIRKDGTVVRLDSSWEEELAKQLDSANIDWIRPGPVKWIDKAGVKRNYFPDFYLPKYNLYLDPKNEQACRVQRDKIECLIDQLPNLRILKTLDECKKFLP